MYNCSRTMVESRSTNKREYCEAKPNGGNEGDVISLESITTSKVSGWLEYKHIRDLQTYEWELPWKMASNEALR